MLQNASKCFKMLQNASKLLPHCSVCVAETSLCTCSSDLSCNTLNTITRILGLIKLSKNIPIRQICVTSSSSIPYCNNSEYWTQKRTQSDIIHSIILDVHVLKAEHKNSPFLFVQLKLDKDIMLLPQLPQKLVMNWYFPQELTSSWVSTSVKE